MLHFVQSNHLEKLFDRLCQVLDEQEDTPLKPLEIVVQNAGMARWVSQQMAIRKGIASNLTFPLPARFIWQILAGQLDVDVVQRDFDRSVLLWRILGELDTALHDSIFSEIQKYLEDDHDGRKIFYLASKIADLFDQYLVYRPDLILSWESGTENGWKSALWKNLIRSSKKHRASYVEQFLTKARQGSLEKSLLAVRLTIRPGPTIDHSGLSSLSVFREYMSFVVPPVLSIPAIRP